MTLEKLLHSDAIRLLRLDPGSPQDELRGELITARLSEDPLFEAISYRYSDPDGTNPQVLRWGIENLYIGDNLANALRHFRDLADVRTIWVDQLCVKQDDDDEKFQQVQIFGNIFSKAKRVLIWLGESDLDSDRAMVRFEEMMHQLRQVDEQLQQGGKPSAEGMSGRTPDAQVLRDFFEKHWFSRVWTLQEAALAQKAEVWCGKKMLPFDVFLDFYERADNDNQGHWTSALEAINTGLGGDDPANPRRNAHQALSTVSKLKTAELLSSARILNIIRPMDCKEQIDRIWSVLRFLPEDLVSALRPFRRTADTSQLYQALAKMALERGELEYLGAAGLTLQRLSYQSIRDDTATASAAKQSSDDKSENSRPELSLPSWVPDWTFIARVNALWVLNTDCERKRGRPLYTAGGRSSESQNISFFNDNKCLRIRAKILHDRVGDLVAPFTIPWVPRNAESRQNVTGFVVDQYQKLDDQMENCFNVASQCAGEARYSNIELACRGTLVGSMVSDSISSTAAGTLIRANEAQISFMFENYQLATRVLQLLGKARTPAELMAAMSGANGEDMMRFHIMSKETPVCDGIKIKPVYVVAAFAEMCKARRFFITNTKRYMGIAPDITQREDRICVIPGCCTPFIIRPVGQHWQLVGECYVHGIMDGEIMQDDKIPLITIVLE